MAFLAASGSSKLNPRISSLSSSASLQSLLFFCSPPDSQNAISAPQPYRRPRANSPPPPQRTETIEETICRMMYQNAWTLRLQREIRKLVPVFDSEFVKRVLRTFRNAENSLRFFRWTERAGLVRHDKETHRKMIQILGMVSKNNYARCILLGMPEKGVEWDEDMFVDMIQSYGKAGIVQESVKMFQKMKELGVERTIKSYNALFEVILRRGRYMMAKRYFNKMVAEGIEPTLVTYNLMIWGFFLSEKVETACRFFQEMKSRGLSPNLVTYNTMINGFFRVKNAEEAEKYFLEMKGMNIKPTVITYTTLIKGYVSMGRVDDALKMFEEMKGCGMIPSRTTYSTLLPGLCDAGKMPEANAALGEMVLRRMEPKDNSIFMRLITEQCNSGDVKAAGDVLKTMMRLDIPIEAGHYGVLIENSCKAGLYDQAVNFVDSLIEKEIILRPENSLNMEPTAYNTIIDYLCNNGWTGKAETLLRQLLKIGVQDSVAFNNLIVGHAKEGAPESAYELLKIMIRRKVPTKAHAYESLIRCYLNQGEPADAKIAFESMIENGHSPDAALYRSLMESLFEDGRIQTASRVMQTMLEKGVKAHMDLLSKILESLLMRGHVGEALGRIELLMQSGLAPDINCLTSVLCENGKSNEALKLLDFCLEKDYSIDISSYDKLLDALLAAEKNLNAYSILCKILAKGLVTDKTISERILVSLNKQGNTRQADILSRMLSSKDKAIDSSQGKKKKKAVAA